MPNEIVANQVSLYDMSQPGNKAALYSNSGTLYYNGNAIYPLTGQSINYNQIIIQSIPLASGITDQAVVFPSAFNIVPNVVYSVCGASESDIIPSQISSLSTGFVQISFAYPIPDINYSLQFFAFASNNYTTYSGTTYQFNSIHVNNSLSVDQMFGISVGIRERLDVSFNSISGALSQAQPGDTIFVNPGLYSGFNLNSNNVTFSFADNAIITGNITLGNNITGNFRNLQLQYSGSGLNGMTLGNNSYVTFLGNNAITLPTVNAVGTGNSINGGTNSIVEFQGDLRHSHAIASNVGIFPHKNLDLYNNVGSGFFVSPSGCPVSIGSGVNNIYYFQNVQQALNFASGARISVLPGYYGGFNIANKSIIDFEHGAFITGGIYLAPNYTGIISDLNCIASGSSTYGLYLDSNSILRIQGNNKISVSGIPSISGNGSIDCFGNIFYNNLFANSVRWINSDVIGKYAGIQVNTGSIPGSGHNGKIYFTGLQDATNFALTGETINVEAGTVSGANVNTPSLIYAFSDNSLVNAPFVLGQNLGNIIFKNFYFDAQANSSINFSVNIPSGTTGVFKGDTFVRIPYFFAPYFIDYSSVTHYTTGFYGTNFTGTPFTSFITGTNISGYYARPAGVLTGYFYSGVNGTNITGAYAAVSGTFVNSIALNNTVGYYISGGNQYNFENGVTGTNISGAYYSGVLNFFQNGITGTNILGYYFSGVTVYYFNGSVAGTGINGYYWTGFQGNFTGNSNTPSQYCTGYYTTGSTLIPNTYFTQGVSANLATGYYYSGGFSGLYVSGLGTVAYTGASATGYNLKQHYVISGNGAALLYNVLANQTFDPNLTLLTSNYTLNTGVFFNPWGIPYLGP